MSDSKIYTKMDSYIIFEDDTDKRPILLLFEFVEFLYLNIDYFNQFVDELLIHKAVLNKQNSLGTKYEDILENRRLQKIIDAKVSTKHRYIHKPIQDKAFECSIYYYDESREFPDSKSVHSSFSGLTSLLRDLSNEFEKGDVSAIMKAKGRYLKFRNRINPHIIISYLEFFRQMDDLMSIVVEDFYIDGDMSIPKIKNTPNEIFTVDFDNLDAVLASHQNKKIELQNTERYPLKTDRIEAIFELIDYLDENIAVFKEHVSIVKEYQQLFFVEKVKIGIPKNYKEKKQLLDINNRLSDLEEQIYNNIVNPLKDKSQELKLLLWYETGSLVDRAKGDINDLKNYLPSKEFIDLIQQYEKKYVAFRKVADLFYTGYNKQENACYSYGYDDASILFFTDLHTSLSDLFGFFGVDEMFKEQDDHPEIVSINHEPTISIPESISPYSKTDSKLYKNDKPIYDNVMDIDYRIVFIKAMKYSNDPEEMREYCIRQQKKAFNENYFSSESFYKGLLRAVHKVKEYAESGYTTMEFEPMGSAGEWFLYLGKYGFRGYCVIHIEVLERIVLDLLYGDKTTQEDSANNQENGNKSISQSSLQPSDIAKPSIKETEAKERIIDKDKLSDYFKSQFKGMGRCENDFEKLIKELEKITDDYEKKRIGKQIAQIALLIHNSGKLNARRPEHFIDWHKIFCECIAIPYIKYFPSKLKPLPKNLIDLFIYLN